MKIPPIFTSLFFSFILYADPHAPRDEGSKSVYNCIHQPTNNLYGGSITSNINVNLQAILSQVQKQVSEISIILRTKIINTISITAHFAQTQWRKFFAVAGLGGYLMLVWYIYRARTWLTSPGLWAQWLLQQHITRTNNAALERALITEIMTRYINPEDPRDTLYPLVLFYADIEEELEYLTCYQTHFSGLHKTYVDKLVVLQIPSTEEISELIQQTYQVRSLFRAWIAHQNSGEYFNQYANVLYERQIISRGIQIDPIL